MSLKHLMTICLFSTLVHPTFAEDAKDTKDAKKVEVKKEEVK